MPNRVRHREHPLSEPRFGQDALHQVCRRLRHPPTHARRAESSTLAAKRHQPALAASLALEVREAPAEKGDRYCWAAESRVSVLTTDMYRSSKHPLHSRVVGRGGIVALIRRDDTNGHTIKEANALTRIIKTIKVTTARMKTRCG
jgi:hypothetical protein